MKKSIKAFLVATGLIAAVYIGIVAAILLATRAADASAIYKQTAYTLYTPQQVASSSAAFISRVDNGAVSCYILLDQRNASGVLYLAPVALSCP